MGLNHLPSSRSPTNAARLAVQANAINLARWTAGMELGDPVATTEALRQRFFTGPDESPARPVASSCIFTTSGLGITSSLVPWRDCAHCHSLRDFRPRPFTHPPSHPTLGSNCASWDTDDLRPATCAENRCQPCLRRPSTSPYRGCQRRASSICIGIRSSPARSLVPHPPLTAAALTLRWIRAKASQQARGSGGPGCRRYAGRRAGSR